MHAALGAWSGLHHKMPHEVPAHRVFYRHYARRDVLTFLSGHRFFGVLAGTLYAVLNQAVTPGATL